LTLALLASTRGRSPSRGKTPDALIKRVSSDVLESIKTDKAVQAGETSRVISAG
jgi:phospholipid transport system substrate-binding protein